MDWQTSIEFRTPINPDAALDIMDTLSEYGVAMTVNAGGDGGGITLTVKADNPRSALDKAADLFLRELPKAEIISFEVKSQEAAARENSEPLFPPVVGYAEIAGIAKVSRQRAREFRKIKSFPRPVISTSQGDLYSEAAVRAWAETRNRKAGRPRKK